MAFIDAMGVERHMGNKMPMKAFGDGAVVYGDTPNTPMIVKSKWKDICNKLGTDQSTQFLTYVHDQNGYGMCNCSATASAMETAHLKTGGAPIKLSAGDLYREISGGSDNGSLLEDGLARAKSAGLATTAVVPYLDWRNKPANSDAGDNKVTVAYLCPTFEHCFSAVSSGFDLISGVMWYNNYNPGADGWLPLRGRGGAGGHAVHGYKPTFKGDTFGIWHKNSWTLSWGLNGCCVFPESAYDGPVGGWWAIGSVTMEAGDTPAPKW